MRQSIILICSCLYCTIITGHTDSRSSCSVGNSRTSTLNISTLNREEVEKFSKLSEQWWNVNGPLRALHSYNSLRVPLTVSTINGRAPGKKRILDVGCGGGLMTEAIAKSFHSLGYLNSEIEIIGIDPSNDVLLVARAHLPPALKGKVTYLCDTIENYVANHPSEKFDTVVMSEVIEHVDNPEEFVKYAGAIVKPGGSIILTTPAKSILSWLVTIFIPERILRSLPTGTHFYEKFVALEESRRLLNNNGFKVVEEKGALYNPITNSWSWNRKAIHIYYAIHAVKI